MNYWPTDFDSSAASVFLAPQPNHPPNHPPDELLFAPPSFLACNKHVTTVLIHRLSANSVPKYFITNIKEFTVSSLLSLWHWQTFGEPYTVLLFSQTTACGFHSLSKCLGVPTSIEESQVTSACLASHQGAVQPSCVRSLASRISVKTHSSMFATNSLSCSLPGMIGSQPDTECCGPGHQYSTINWDSVTRHLYDSSDNINVRHVTESQTETK